MHQQHQGISSISTTAASAHQQYKQHQRISASAHQQHQRISSISSISASAVAALLAHQQYDDDDVIYHESWCWWWIYDSKQKRPALHTSERTIVPRTVIFYSYLIIFNSCAKSCCHHIVNLNAIFFKGYYGDHIVLMMNVIITIAVKWSQYSDIVGAILVRTDIGSVL